MVEKVIVIQNKETTEDGTLIITMQPVANARWTSNSGLIEAGVAVQPYGVFMIPAAESFVATGLMADVSINQVLFSTPLSALIAGDAEDEITFAAPYLNLTDLQDVAISSVENGQVLKWDSTAGKWVNGDVSSGGDGGNYVVTMTLNEGTNLFDTNKSYNDIAQAFDAGQNVIFVTGDTEEYALICTLSTFYVSDGTYNVGVFAYDFDGPEFVYYLFTANNATDNLSQSGLT